MKREENQRANETNHAGMRWTTAPFKDFRQWKLERQSSRARTAAALGTTKATKVQAAKPVTFMVGCGADRAQKRLFLTIEAVSASAGVSCSEAPTNEARGLDEE